MTIQVALAVIRDSQHRFLITQRPLHVSHGGYWEFPGGKLERNEPAELALVREIKEEVNLTILRSQFLGTVEHQYSDKKVSLITFLVTDFSGKPSCREGQLGIKWVTLQELNPNEFPEANQEVIALVRRHYHKQGQGI